MPILLLLWLLAVGCNTPHDPSSATENPGTQILAGATVAETRLTPTSTDRSVAAVTLTPTATPSPSATPSATATPQPTGTATPQPTDTPIPPTPTPSVVTFAVIGDYGDPGQGTQDVAALVDSWQPDFIITVGDNNYPNGEATTIEANITQHYGDYIARGDFFPALGNHDYYSGNGAQPYFDYFVLPNNERYYDFVRGDVHLFALNSDWNEPDGIGAGSAQAAWLRDRLAASQTAWQVVYFHVAPFVSREDSVVAALRWPFAAWGADLVLYGHAHLYERLAIDGIPYIVNGLGGHSIYAFDETPHPASQMRFNGNFGAVRVEATASTLTAAFITRYGSVIDTVVVSRQAALTRAATLLPQYE